MKYILLLSCLTSAVSAYSQTGGVGIGTTTPAPSAVLDVNDSTRGLLVPRLTSAQMTAIASPDEGLIVYNKTAGRMYAYSTKDTVLAKYDQISPNAPQFLTSMQPWIGQNFIPTQPGRFSGVRLRLFFFSTLPRSLTVEFYTTGPGNTSFILGSTTYSITPPPGQFPSPADSVIFFPLPSPYPVSSTAVSAFRIICNNCGTQASGSHVALQAHAVNPGSPYSGGTMFIHPVYTPSSTTDLLFEAVGRASAWQPLHD